MEIKSNNNSKWFSLKPQFTKLCTEEQSLEMYKNFVLSCKIIEEKLNNIKRNSFSELTNFLRQELLPECVGEVCSTNNIALQLAKSVVLDLIVQGWNLKVAGDSDVQVCSPQPSKEIPTITKERIRGWHLVERNAQLKESSVAEFIKNMERRRLTKKGWHSIFSLMRDGKNLSEKLQLARQIENEDERIVALEKTISPYLQFVEGDSLCEHTGLQLREIWRYFRHTWVNAYKSVPGRSIMILIRDAAAPNHPVIGIAALGSSVVQQSLRDKWIGWDSNEFLEKLLQNPTSEKVNWLFTVLESLINGIYTQDLEKEGLCSLSIITCPSDEIINKLRDESKKAIKQHQVFPRTALHKNINTKQALEEDWKEKALTSLFRSKRCEILATLLSIKKAFNEHNLNQKDICELPLVLKSPRVRFAIGQLIRLVKAEHVGIDMMDITICGAIYPYNLLLGGKLVCMLLCSPEVVEYYYKRYEEQVSIIASSMKGSAVKRKPNLVLLCTTSLYGVGSSQYNRIKIPAQFASGNYGEYLQYKELGLSEGFGSFHFSQDTISLINVLIARRKEGRRVNSIFGEGVNPKMRKIREGLDLISLSSDSILRHGNRRVVYAIPLARNFKEVLIGFDKTPQYFIPLSEVQEKTSLIASYWKKRWLSKRILSLDILNKVADHTLSYPIEHGAKVPIVDEPSLTGHLWDELNLQKV